MRWTGTHYDVDVASRRIPICRPEWIPAESGFFFLLSCTNMYLLFKLYVFVIL